MALLPGERAGKVCTVSAGAISLEAALYVRPGENLSPPILPDPSPGVRYHAIRRDGDREAHCLSCEIRAVRGADLAAAVDDLLRALSAHAALAGAVLQTRVVRLCEPLVPDVLLVGGIARALRSADLGVSFGPSWTPVSGASVCVGASGREREIERIFREHCGWQPILF